MQDNMLGDIAPQAKPEGVNQAELTITPPATPDQPPAPRPVTEPPSVEELRTGGFSHPEIPRITAEKLKLMMDEAWVIQDDFVLVNIEEDIVSSSIKGCKFIYIQYSSGAPLLTNDVLFMLRRLPKDKPIIFYDSGVKDLLSAAMAKVLIDLNEGYKPENIKVLWQGFGRWRELGYPYEEVILKMED